MEHGSPDSEHRHAGDLGNINSTSEENTFISDTYHGISLQVGNDANIIDRSIVIHENADTFTGKAGNAGGRIACCVITPGESTCR